MSRIILVCLCASFSFALTADALAQVGGDQRQEFVRSTSKKTQKGARVISETVGQQTRYRFENAPRSEQTNTNQNQNQSQNQNGFATPNNGPEARVAFRQAANQAPSLNPNNFNNFNNNLNPCCRVAQCNCNVGAPPNQLQFPGFGQGSGTAQNFSAGFQSAPFQPNSQALAFGQNQSGFGQAQTGFGFQPNIGVPQFNQTGGSWWTPFLTGSGYYPPLLNFRNLPQGSYLGQGLIGQPTAYVDGQPFRNLLRYISP